MSACLSARLSVCLCLSACLYLSVCLPVCPPVSLSVCVWLPVCPSPWSVYLMYIIMLMNNSLLPFGIVYSLWKKLITITTTTKNTNNQVNQKRKLEPFESGRYHAKWQSKSWEECVKRLLTDDTAFGFPVFKNNPDLLPKSLIVRTASSNEFPSPKK